MSAWSAFTAGLIFGLGLIVSGMSDPSKVIGFLDLAGAWDPSLAFVMVGAILVGLVAWRVAGGRAASFLGGAMPVARARQIDGRLVAGSIVFGVGWGLAGFCPGPALVSFGSGEEKAVAFTLAMLGGMAIYELTERWATGTAAKDEG